MNDEAIIEVYDVLTGAVIRGEHNLFRRGGEAPFAASGEVHEVFNRRAAEPIKRLIVVADDTDVFVAAGELEEDLFLDRVRVLVFIDDHVPKDAACRWVLAHMVSGDLLDKRKVSVAQSPLIAEKLEIRGVAVEQSDKRLVFCALPSIRRIHHLLGESIEETDQVRNGLVARSSTVIESANYARDP